MKVLITGSSGLIGTALARALNEHGHDVGRLLRHKAASGAPFWNPDARQIDLGDFGDADAVVHLAGENLSAGRWTAARKARLVSSRVDSTRLLAEHLARQERRPRVLISGSAVGYYGHRGDETVDESAPRGTGFLPDLCAAWEEAARPAADAGIRLVFIRTGVVLSPAGGALAKMLLPFRLGLGGALGDGRHYVSWISLDDMVAASEFLIANDALRGPVNLTSPAPVTNAEFTRTLAAVLRRPAFLRMPAFAARILFGEMADAVLLSGARVLPAKLLAAGYVFRHPDLACALRELLGKPEPQ